MTFRTHSVGPPVKSYVTPGSANGTPPLKSAGVTPVTGPLKVAVRAMAVSLVSPDPEDDVRVRDGGSSEGGEGQPGEARRVREEGIPHHARQARGCYAQVRKKPLLVPAAFLSTIAPLSRSMATLRSVLVKPEVMTTVNTQSMLLSVVTVAVREMPEAVDAKPKSAAVTPTTALVNVAVYVSVDVDTTVPEMPCADEKVGTGGEYLRQSKRALSVNRGVDSQRR